MIKHKIIMFIAVLPVIFSTQAPAMPGDPTIVIFGLNSPDIAMDVIDIFMDDDADFNIIDPSLVKDKEYGPVAVIKKNKADVYIIYSYIGDEFSIKAVSKDRVLICHAKSTRIEDAVNKIKEKVGTWLNVLEVRRNLKNNGAGAASLFWD